MNTPAPPLTRWQRITRTLTPRRWRAPLPQGTRTLDTIEITSAEIRDELGVGEPGDRFRDADGDIWAWTGRFWRCGKWILAVTDESQEFGPFTRVDSAATVCSAPPGPLAGGAESHQPEQG